MNTLTVMCKRATSNFKSKYFMFTPSVDELPETEAFLKTIKINGSPFDFYGFGYKGAPFYYPSKDQEFICYYDPAWLDHFDEEGYKDAVTKA